MSLIHFKGKPFVQNLHLSVKYHELVPVRGKGSGENIPSLHDNLIIHGDNLKALKSLLPTYAGRVKCIIIDPPYNTGNENWVYNDNVSSPMMQEWLGKIVDTEDLTRHDKWLCMMTPRLKLLKELLSEDGVIFICIDDNEQHRLRMLMDEIFGDENFLVQIIWKKRSTPPNDQIIGTIHDYIMVYSKNKEYLNINLKERTEDQLSRYKNPDNHSKGPWAPGDLMANVKGGRYVKSLYYPIINPETGAEHYPSSNGNWRFNKEKIEDLIKKGEIYFGDDGKGRPKLKRFLCDVKEGVTYSTFWDFAPFNQIGSKEMADILGDMNIFDSPKPSGLIKEFIKLGTNSDSIILDSFAGTGTTAHAVLALNKEDGGNRKFILVECEDYADRITAERVRRVIKGVPSSKDKNLQEGLGGTFSYFELGKAIELESILDGSNLPSVIELARYIFFTATGIEFDERKIQGIGQQESGSYIGSTEKHDIFLVYKPDLEYLKSTALNVELAKEIENFCREKLQNSGKKRMVFAPTKYLDEEYLDKFRIDFCQLPFEIYRMAER